MLQNKNSKWKATVYHIPSAPSIIMNYSSNITTLKQPASPYSQLCMLASWLGLHKDNSCLLRAVLAELTPSQEGQSGKASVFCSLVCSLHPEASSASFPWQLHSKGVRANRQVLWGFSWEFPVSSPPFSTDQKKKKKERLAQIQGVGK